MESIEKWENPYEIDVIFGRQQVFSFFFPNNQPLCLAYFFFPRCSNRGQQMGSRRVIGKIRFVLSPVIGSLKRRTRASTCALFLSFFVSKAEFHFDLL